MLYIITIGLYFMTNEFNPSRYIRVNYKIWYAKKIVLKLQSVDLNRLKKHKLKNYL